MLIIFRIQQALKSRGFGEARGRCCGGRSRPFGGGPIARGGGGSRSRGLGSTKVAVIEVCSFFGLRGHPPPGLENLVLPRFKGLSGELGVREPSDEKKRGLSSFRDPGERTASREAFNDIGDNKSRLVCLCFCFHSGLSGFVEKEAYLLNECNSKGFGRSSM